MLLTDRHLPSGFEMSEGRGGAVRPAVSASQASLLTPGEAMEQGAEVLAGPLAVNFPLFFLVSLSPLN